LIDAAAVFIKNNKLILLFPFFVFLLLCFALFFWGYSTVIGFESKIYFYINKVGEHPAANLIIFLHFFGFLWTVEVLLCFIILSVAIAVSTYYFFE